LRMSPPLELCSPRTLALALALLSPPEENDSIILNKCKSHQTHNLLLLQCPMNIVNNTTKHSKLKHKL
jgi:hypothetical protein